MKYDQEPRSYKIQDYQSDGTPFNRAVGGITHIPGQEIQIPSASQTMQELKDLEARLNTEIPPMQPDRTRSVRTVVAAGCLAIQGGTIIPVATDFIVYTTLGVGVFLGSIGAVKYGIQKYLN